MGTWDIGPFDNDDAGDLVTEVAGSGGLALIEGALDAVIKSGDGYLEAPDSQRAIAAAEIVAVLNGKPSVKFPPDDEILGWLSRSKIKPEDAFKERARLASKRVLSEPSELLELWSESDELEGWRGTVEDLILRLS